MGILALQRTLLHPKYKEEKGQTYNFLSTWVDVKLVKLACLAS